MIGWCVIILCRLQCKHLLVATVYSDNNLSGAKSHSMQSCGDCSLL